jgi:hypothetical protein
MELCAGHEPASITAGPASCSSLRGGRIAEAEAAVAAEAGKLLAEKQDLTALRGIGYGPILATVMVAVIGDRAEIMLRSKHASAFLTFAELYGSESPGNALLNRTRYFGSARNAGTK